MILIALTGLEMFTRTMTFENMHFWVRGDSHVLWGAMWIILFLYWNFCILYARKLTTSTINRRLLLWYSFLSIGASFLLSLAYGYIATLSQRLVNTSELSALGCFDALKDSPSIWCTFALVHIFLIPLLFSLMEKHYQVDIPYEKREISWQSKLVMAILAAGVLFFLALTVPLFFTISIKMVTK
ncbi:MAG: hypothetical protein Q8P95_02410 [bacterium]|nr:hypothetical protein [bacterium]